MNTQVQFSCSLFLNKNFYMLIPTTPQKIPINYLNKRGQKTELVRFWKKLRKYEMDSY